MFYGCQWKLVELKDKFWFRFLGWLVGVRGKQQKIPLTFNGLGWWVMVEGRGFTYRHKDPGESIGSLLFVKNALILSTCF